MAQWNRINQTRENGETVEMVTPLILSVSRSTDIPAFYADWFFHRLQKGYCKWTNPFNGVPQYISFAQVRFIVFWTKNPAPLLPHLKELEQRGIGWYIQYTLNDYEAEGLEKGVPPLSHRIDTFRRLADTYGNDRVIWRFDPLLLTDRINQDTLLDKIQGIGDRLHHHTRKLVFSFADITNYAKVRRNLDLNGIRYVDWGSGQMQAFAERLTLLNRPWGLELATCSEKIDLDTLGIRHNRCIDDDLIIRIASGNPEFMQFLGVTFHSLPPADLFGTQPTLPPHAIPLPDGRYALHAKNGDTGQRALCGCIQSKDIGRYNTCVHHCEYCYANASKQAASQNFDKHRQHPFAESIY